MFAMTKPVAGQPALTRLAALAALDVIAIKALQDAIGGARFVRARRELVAEGSPAQRLLIVSGWAARVRQLADGRRQLLGILLPGDLIGNCRHPEPLAMSTVTAMSDVSVCVAPPASVSPSLDEAYAISHAYEEAYLLAQITRLGRLNAQERIGDFLLELSERLEMSGLAQGGSFELPLTQETLADALGLTSVHVNRMLQLSRKEGDLVLHGGRLTLPNSAMLAHKVGRSPVRVTGREQTHVDELAAARGRRGDYRV